MYKAILFDLGGVLFTNGTTKFIESVSSRYSLPKQQVKEVIDGRIGTLYRETKISRNEFWESVKRNLNLKETADQLEKEWIDAYELISETKQIIQHLSRQYSLYYLSDNVKERVNSLNAKFNFIQLFKGGIFSHEVGVRKPNPLIYEYAIKKAGCNSNEIIFIDYKPSALLPADKMGITTIFFQSSQQLKESLVKLGVY
ncbi:hypothetical protein A3C98_00065 [Candidatus Roizmanbacteria bacterium RIFCSPHIGHO2_02_FULL_37_15]|uniref:HAD family hydrolase n=1 Tax=Candidatus Roizmanbacteria bacterium RIFCSPLOWO2_01_FULL_37_16 TaxID=1802058 RepID=A0A1F7IKR7_9BACT|nr:MAG: hypothetical protein A2859_04750 [Candidatus Roizmanbacteria bacterium RIFCSPHIGHO2_01_FULL_37_16b]OGK22272.1 MAG: hypothetical protein A3C98_00065 [Candidatus Roizmanbacteria bacterium RIFCSPHIGHO2_02_FULL_37_15]OGK43945.1 MAG: hypothetical protein A3B40_04025 [Candidatus Roizmanbacteria bacterium RIFCSPLOWO2_01_FULL_37_16]OGK56437.1 MAG: hypothetical protein A3I50_00350 [Candidatus Roizmanbacteria bacterium RIFCSPLOWO2_02_FULL_37_9]